MEATDDHVLETVALNLRPVLHLVRGNVLGVAGDVVRRIGIAALGTNGGHQLVVLVGNEILGSHLRDAVDATIGHAARLGVGQLAILLVALLDVVEKGCLLGGVGNAKLPRALEHDVFQVVSQACRLGRIVLRTRADGNVRLNARLLLVNTEVDLQSVLQRIDAGLGEVVLDLLVLVLFTRSQSQSYQGCCHKQLQFHITS